MTRTRTKPKNGCIPEVKPGRPFDTYLTLGSFRIRIEREKYLEWEAAIRSEFEFDAKRIEAEILRRIRL